MTAKPNQLHRLPNQGMIAGVAAGFAQYFKIDPTVMRLIFVAIALASFGTALLGYIILVVVLPVDTRGESKLTTHSSEKSRQFLGGALIIFGAVMVVRQLLPDSFDIPWGVVWSAVVILVGVWVITGGTKRGK